MLRIVATHIETNKRFVCFHWTHDAESGIARAKRDAVKFKMDHLLTDYRAEQLKLAIIDGVEEYVDA